jgi:hypothetical protein
METILRLILLLLSFEILVKKEIIDEMFCFSVFGFINDNSLLGVAYRVALEFERRRRIKDLSWILFEMQELGKMSL